MIFNSTIATNDSGNWQNEINVEIEGKANASDNLEGYGITDAYSKNDINMLLPQILRNANFRLLDEPKVYWSKNNNTVSINWEDPPDILTNEPCPISWEGTVLIKKEGSAPLNKWDGVQLVNSTVRNSYKDTPFLDTLSGDATYYYGVFPYDDNEIIKHYTWTSIFEVNSTENPLNVLINSASTLGVNSIQINYTLPTENYVSAILVYKPNAIPSSINDGTSISITGNSCDINNLTMGTSYGFIIYVIDNNHRIYKSNSITASTKAGLNILPLLTSTSYYYDHQNNRERGTVVHNSDGTVTITVNSRNHRSEPYIMPGKAAVTANKIDLTGYTTLKYIIKSIDSGLDGMYMGGYASVNKIWNDDYLSYNFSSRAAMLSWYRARIGQTISINISNISSKSAYIGIGAFQNSLWEDYPTDTGIISFTVEKMWLE